MNAPGVTREAVRSALTGELRMPMATALDDGVFLDVNPAFEALVARPASEIVGRPLDAFVAPAERAQFAELHPARAGEDGAPSRCELTFLRPSGEARRVVIHATSMRVDGRQGVALLCDDVTAQRRAEEFLGRLAEAGRTVLRQRDRPSVLRAACGELARLGLGAAIFFREDGAAPAWTLQVLQLPGAELATPPVRFAANAFPGFEDVLLAGRPRFYERLSGLDLEKLAERDPAAAVAMREASGVHAPLALDDGTQGMLVGFMPRLSPDDVAAVGVFAGQLAAALEGARRLEDLARRNTELTLLNRVAAAAAHLDRGEFLREVNDALCGFLHVPAIGVYRRVGERLQVEYQGTSPGVATAAAALGKLTFAMGESVVGRAALTREVVIVDIASVRGGAALAREGIRVAVAIPVAVRDRVVGVLTFALRGDRTLGARELATLRSVGDAVAVHLDSVDLLERERRRSEDLTLLVRLSHELAGPLDMAVVIDRALKALSNLLEAPVATFLRHEPETDTICIEASAEPRGTVGTYFGRDQRPHVWQVLDEDRAQAFDDVGRVPFAPDGPSYAAAAAPLRSRGATLGVLLVAAPQPRRFTEAERELLSAVAAQLGAAVATVRLHEDLRARVRELELINEVARTSAPLGTEQTFTVTLGRICEALAFSSGTIRLLDDQGALRLAARFPAEGGPGFPELRPVGDVPDWRDGGAGARRLPAEGLAALGLVHGCAVPLATGGRASGLLALARDTERPISDAELRLVEALAAQLATAVDNLRLLSEAKRRARELALVQEVSASVVGATDARSLMETAIARLTEVLETDGARVYVVAGDHAEVLAERWKTPPAGQAPAAPVPLSDAVAHALLVEGRSLTYTVDDLPPERGLRYADVGIGELCGAPLVGKSGILGCLVVARGRGRPFSASELSVVRALGSQLGVALENARLYDEAHRRVEELRLLNDVGVSLVSSLDLGHVLGVATEALARLLEASDVFVLLADRVHGGLVVAGATEGARARALGHVIPLDSATPAVVSFLERRAVSVDDLSTSTHAFDIELVGRFHLRSLVAVPLLSGEQALGAIAVGDRRPRRWSAAELARASGVANQVALAVLNARLYDDLKQSYDALARTQRQLVQRERLAALGELAAIVAHEVRNPLGVIFNSVGALRRALAPSAGDAAFLLAAISEEADRLNRIVGDLLDFARPPRPALAPTSVGEICEEAVATVSGARGAGGARYDVRLAVQRGLPRVPVDRRMLRQALVNLLTNAEQAMPRGGRIVVEARLEAGSAVVGVRDEGPGIPSEIRNRIFEPFFTTKATGTGLGLAVVRRILDAHGGEVTVTTGPGLGTQVLLHLPLEPAPLRSIEELASPVQKAP